MIRYFQCGFIIDLCAKIHNRHNMNNIWHTHTLGTSPSKRRRRRCYEIFIICMKINFCLYFTCVWMCRLRNTHLTHAHIYLWRHRKFNRWTNFHFKRSCDGLLCVLAAYCTHCLLLLSYAHTIQQIYLQATKFNRSLTINMLAGKRKQLSCIASTYAKNGKLRTNY